MTKATLLTCGKLVAAGQTDSKGDGDPGWGSVDGHNRGSQFLT